MTQSERAKAAPKFTREQIEAELLPLFRRMAAAQKEFWTVMLEIEEITGIDLDVMIDYTDEADTVEHIDRCLEENYSMNLDDALRDVRDAVRDVRDAALDTTAKESGSMDLRGYKRLWRAAVEHARAVGATKEQIAEAEEAGRRS